MTPLSDVCATGDLPEVNRLLAQGEDATASNNEAICLAAYHGHLSIVDRLLQVPGLDLAPLNNKAYQHLYRGWVYRNVMDQLLKGPHLNVKALRYEAVCLAASRGHLSVIDRLLQVPGVNDTALNGEQLLQMPGVNNTILNNKAFFLAAINGHLSIIERIFNTPGVNVTPYKNNAICRAALNGHAEVVKRLLQISGEDSTADDTLVIFWAGFYEHLTLMANWVPWVGTELIEDISINFQKKQTPPDFSVAELIGETIRLQILADFYANHRKEQLKRAIKYLTLDFFDKSQQAKFEQLVFKIVGLKKSIWSISSLIKKIDNYIFSYSKDFDFEPIVKEKIIQRTYAEYKKHVSIRESLSEIIPKELLNLISDYDESLAQSPEINYLIKEETIEAQKDKPVEVLQDKSEQNNLNLQRNKMLSLMHFELHKSIGEKGQDPKVNNEFNNKGLNLR
ncbi:MAG: ankyrin [Francisellaceae bacterium]|nr:ankyrin [Francisellaceae bacterium]